MSDADGTDDGDGAAGDDEAGDDEAPTPGAPATARLPRSARAEARDRKGLTGFMGQPVSHAIAVRRSTVLLAVAFLACGALSLRFPQSHEFKAHRCSGLRIAIQNVLHVNSQSEKYFITS